jgi:hypothetical protein
LYGGLVPPYGDPDNRHGQLLVRYPGEVHAEGRPEAPSWRPVVLLTFFLSVLGAVSATRRAATAKRYGRPRAPYWMAFVLTLVGGAVFWAAVAVFGALPLYLSLREQAVTEVVQENLLADSRVETELAADVSGGECTPEGERAAGGTRTYLCTFTLTEGGKASLYIRADERGNWEMVD